MGAAKILRSAKLLMILSIFYLLSADACKVSKVDAVDCFFGKADRNGDDRVSMKDLEYVAATALPWYLRWGFSALGGTSQIMKECDLNGDKQISSEEALEASAGCLSECDRRSKTVELLQC